MRRRPSGYYSPFVERFELEISLIIFVLIIGLCRVVHADPIDTSNVHLKSASTCTTAKGSTVQLPPGYFLDEAKFAALDAEVRRAQDAETRLTAENASFRAHPPSAGPSWWTIILPAVSAAVVLAIQHL
jgi:hypothetical protein